jgi:hypothetical protein
MTSAGCTVPDACSTAPIQNYGSSSNGPTQSHDPGRREVFAAGHRTGALTTGTRGEDRLLGAHRPLWRAAADLSERRVGAARRLGAHSRPVGALLLSSLHGSCQAAGDCGCLTSDDHSGPRRCSDAGGCGMCMTWRCRKPFL